MSYLVYVLIFLALHACNARHLGLADKRTSIEVSYKGSIPAQKYTKDVGKAEQLLHNGENEKGETLSSLATASMMEINLNNMNIKGYATKVSSSGEDLQVALKIEGWKRQERSTFETVPHNVEDPIKSKEDDILEDVVAMDYAQPHRKPPIHNMKP